MPCSCGYLLWNMDMDKAKVQKANIKSEITSNWFFSPGTLCKSELICIIIYYSYRFWSPYWAARVSGAAGRESQRSAQRKALMDWHSRRADHQLRVSAKPSASCLLTKTYAHHKTHLKRSSGTLTALFSHFLSGSPHTRNKHNTHTPFPANTRHRR